MPNWCENDFYVHGPRSSINKMIDEVFSEDEDEDLVYPDFNKITPYPQKFKDMDDAAMEAKAKGIGWDKMPKDGFNSGGYEWCCEKWGTKWGACNPSPLRYTAKGITQTFSTAWAPPLPVIKALAEKYPELTFIIEYFEMGVAYQGVLKVKGTEILEEDEREYHGKRGG